MTVWIKGCSAFLALALIAVPARADEVSEAINDALAAYEEGDLDYAKETLEFATQLIAQQKTATLAALLPEPLEGWDAGEAEETSAGAAMFGGGSIVSRRYTKDGKNLSIQFIADSPMLAQMGALFANPALIGASGGKLVRIGRERGMFDNSGSFQMLVDNRVMIQIEGSADEDAKLAYAKAMDMKALKDF